MESELLAELEKNGIVRLPDLMTGAQLQSMQAAFATRLTRMRWNNCEGYEETERYRHMIEDVLTLDQGFVDLALHPVVKAVLRGYLVDRFQLVEAKGWRSLPTRRDFHGWHGDMWYNQRLRQDIPREVKLAMYLTDVETGAFQYRRGTHRKQPPRAYTNAEVARLSPDSVLEVAGSAGSAFLFDTSGIHRQGVPILDVRHAIFYNYHDAAVPLQEEDRAYYRYHPLLLNAAFLGQLSAEDQNILGFGDKRRYVPAFRRRSGHERLERVFRSTFEVRLRAAQVLERVGTRVQRLWGPSRGALRARDAAEPSAVTADGPDLAHGEWRPFILSEYSFAGFPRGAWVLDVGCGGGSQLATLAARGCVAVGADVSSASLAFCRGRALRVVQARAEELPIRSGVLDGVVCKVALPYTEELVAVAEISRVLKPGGRAIVCSHAIGYYVRYALFSPTARRVFYTLRTVLNTLIYCLTRRRLPNFLGDTLYQSRRRLHRYYRANKLSIVGDHPAPTYLALPVFLYHEVEKTS